MPCWKKGLTSDSCPLTSVHMPWYVCPNTKINKCNLLIKYWPLKCKKPKYISYINISRGNFNYFILKTNWATVKQTIDFSSTLVYNKIKTMQLIPYPWVMTNSGKKRRTRIWNNRKPRNTKQLGILRIWFCCLRATFTKDL